MGTCVGVEVGQGVGVWVGAAVGRGVGVDWGEGLGTGVQVGGDLYAPKAPRPGAEFQFVGHHRLRSCWSTPPVGSITT